ncbi:hypothetical protein MTO96_000911 [Rhipicephalus appendiculatus]
MLDLTLITSPREVPCSVVPDPTVSFNHIINKTLSPPDDLDTERPCTRLPWASGTQGRTPCWWHCRTTLRRVAGTRITAGTAYKIRQSKRLPSQGTDAVTLEGLKSLYNCCFTCGVSWAEDQASLDCAECGGYALHRPCVHCNGSCGTFWTRDLVACRSALGQQHCHRLYIDKSSTITPSPSHLNVSRNFAAARTRPLNVLRGYTTSGLPYHKAPLSTESASHGFQ